MVKRMSFMGEHSLQTGVGMIGIGGIEPEADSAVKAFQSTGSSQVLTGPVREELLAVC